MDDAYRHVLPYLRPQPGDVSWLALAAAALLAAVVAVGLAWNLIRGRRQRVRMRRGFYRAARARGLSSRQARYLWRTASLLHLRDPHMLLKSQTAFDRHLGRRGSRLAASITRRRRARSELRDLAEIRRFLGFDLLRPGARPVSTHQLTEGQLLELELVGSESGRPWASRLVRTDELP